MIEWIFLVRLVGTITCVAGVLIGLAVARKHFAGIPESMMVSLGIATISAAAFWKLTAFVGIVVLPVATIAVANYHTVEGVHEVEACSRCHVMRPMVNDLMDSNSDTLAARHFKNVWIPTNQCYACHSNYGFTGDMAAKMEGFRHLARYTTHTYPEPIAARHTYDNQQCLKCHEQMPKFQAVQSHHTVKERLASSNMSCLNCHGKAHPTRADRTPGSPRYDELIKKPSFKESKHE